MDDIIYGTITMALAIFLYTLAYKKYKTNNYQHAIILVMLGGLAFRIFTSFDLYLHAWDERYHALVAKNILSNPLKPMLYSTPLLDYDYRHWTSNHIWIHKQPFPLYTMALSMWIFGKNVIALRLPSILFSTLGILSTYKIGQMLESKKVGLISAFLFSINGLIIEQTAGRVATDHIDVFFFSLISFAVYFLLKNAKFDSRSTLILGSVITGLAILSKWLPALIVLPVWILYSYKKKPNRKILIDLLSFSIIVSVVVLPWQLYILHYFPMEASWEYAFNRKHLFETLGTHGEPFYYHINRMRIIFGELVYIPLMWMIYTGYDELRKGITTKFLLLIWISIPYLFFSLAQTKMQGYILFCAPAIFIMTAMFFVNLQDYKTKIPYIKPLILFLLIALPIRYSIERIKPFNNREIPQWISKIKEIEAQNKNQKAVVFNTQHPIETMFHTDMVAYETKPDLDNLNRIKNMGYKIYIDNNDAVSSELLNIDYVEYIELNQKE